jgi:AcrR family transcriptional regulator
MRKKKADWMELGLKILAQDGRNGLTIDNMTEAMGVTKGSFYHHFNNVGDFNEQLIAHWADQYTSTSAAIPEDSVELLTLLDRIMEEGFRSVIAPEAAIRIWAHQDEQVRETVEKVERTRKDFVLKVFRSLTGDEDKAQMMTDILFTMMVGSIIALPRIPSSRVVEMYTEFKRLYQIGE